MKYLLLTSTLFLTWNIDLGKDKAPFRTAEEGKKIFQDMYDPDTDILDEIHGLMVISEDRKIEFTGSMSGQINVLVPLEKFVNCLKDNCEMNFSFSETQVLALELFNSSQSEGSERSKFISLATIVECLAQTGKRSQNIQDFLDETIKKVEESNLSKSEKDELKNILREDKKQSISKLCNQYVEKILGEDAAKEFKRYYNIRSELVHTGKTSKTNEVENNYSKFKDLVSRLLVNCLIKLNQN
ncbi:MAG: hypothetical protein LRZ84_15620 [Desertifilum sp.]|nr:hypothetical protein [Desertifilum sp.]